MVAILARSRSARDQAGRPGSRGPSKDPPNANGNHPDPTESSRTTGGSSTRLLTHISLVWGVIPRRLAQSLRCCAGPPRQCPQAPTLGNWPDCWHAPSRAPASGRLMKTVERPRRPSPLGMRRRKEGHYRGEPVTIMVGSMRPGKRAERPSSPRAALDLRPRRGGRLWRMVTIEGSFAVAKSAQISQSG